MARKPRRGPKGLTLLEGTRASGTWRVRVWVTDPKTGRPREIQRRVRGSEDEATAERLRIKAEAEAGGPAAAAPSVSDYAASLMQRRAPRLRPTSAQTLAGMLARAIEYVGPDVLIDRITAGDVEQAANRMRRDGYAVNTVNQSIRRLCSCVGSWYAERGLASPLQHVQHLRPEKRRSENRLTAQQAAWAVALSKHEKYPRWLHPVVLACLTTGARIGEVLALRWDDIDGEVLHIRRSSANAMPLVLPTKTDEPRRAGLHPMLADALTEWRQHMVAAQVDGVESGWCFPAMFASRRAVDCPLSYRAAARRWATLCDDLGIEDVRLHGLRRTHMDLARLAGVSAVVTRAIVGHASEAETHRYSTVDDGERRAAVAEVVSILTGRRK